MRALYFEDEEIHCHCGHQLNEHRDGDNPSCAYADARNGRWVECDCEQFEHSRERDQEAADHANEYWS